MPHAPHPLTNHTYIPPRRSEEQLGVGMGRERICKGGEIGRGKGASRCVRDRPQPQRGAGCDVHEGCRDRTIRGLHESGKIFSRWRQQAR